MRPVDSRLDPTRPEASARPEAPTHVPNPRRVAACRLNLTKRKGLTPEGRERLRQAAIKNQPWRFSTGPRTAAGKAKMILNGKKRQLGPRSVREVRAELAGLRALLRDMQTTRAALTGGIGADLG
jgi:hypothetical protein